MLNNMTGGDIFTLLHRTTALNNISHGVMYAQKFSLIHLNSKAVITFDSKGLCENATLQKNYYFCQVDFLNIPYASNVMMA